MLTCNIKMIHGDILLVIGLYLPAKDAVQYSYCSKELYNVVHNNIFQNNTASFILIRMKTDYLKIIKAILLC